MNIIAIIPARGGSKRLPGKNLLPVAGLPLVAHSILHARHARLVQKVYVSTDDAEIAQVARGHGVEVVMRPAQLATDEATSELALLHVLDERNRLGLEDPELVVFQQCTSPVRRPCDIDRAIKTLMDIGADSLFSARKFNRLIWTVEDGQSRSLNYNFHKRQREQDMAVQFQENGSIYVFRPEVLRRDNNRLGGKIAIYEMDEWSSFQVDTPAHVELIDWILRRPEYAPPIAWTERIELVVFDFDGVMTDNTVLVSEDGQETVRCHRGDGWGIGQLHKAGIPMLVLSTEKNPVVAARCAKLGLTCHQGIENKARYLLDYLKGQRIDPRRVAYVGNDDNDRDCLMLVGFPVVVGDSHPSVLSLAKLVLSRRGGDGAVREFCDRLLLHLAAAAQP